MNPVNAETISVMIVEDDPAILERLSKVVRNNAQLTLHANVSTVAGAKEFLIENLKILDNSGRTIIKKNNLATQNYQLNISALPSGIYFIEIGSNDKKMVRKFMKSKN